MNPLFRKFGAVCCIAVLMFSVLLLRNTARVSAVSPDLPQGDKEKVREAFLAGDAGASTFLALASYPELFEDREVKMKLFRSFTSKDLNVFKPAVELGMKAPQIDKDPMLGRRFNLAFIGRDPQKRKAILDLAVSNDFVKDLRVIGLLSESLVDPDATLADTALSIVRSDKSLQELPAIAEALSRRPGGTDSPKVKLPDYQFFKEKVELLFVTPGKDQKACVNCHETHPILKLLPTDPNQPAEDQVTAHYRSALRVVDPRDPERSLLAIKPTNPSPPEGSVAAPSTHEGGVRWEKDSPSYQTILEWIRTGAAK